MEREIVETISYRGFDIEIYQDDDPFSPNEYIEFLKQFDDEP
jgi:hypothetical protein